MASSHFTTMTSLFLLFLLLNSAAAANPDTQATSECDVTSLGECYNKAEALRLKLIAIATILIASFIGVCLPLFSRSVSALRPDGNIFFVVKAFASGVILATGYMHVLPDSFDNLSSPCLPEKPWSKFPFTGFVAMLSAIFTLMVDSLMLTFYNRRKKTGHSATVVDHESPMQDMTPVAHVHGHGHGHCGVPQLDLESKEGQETTLLRNRIIAQVLEMGIIVHSVVIGLSMGASQNPCTIRPLVAALCFHQLFEGMGLGGCILQAEYGLKMKAILAFFFATTTPFGVALGIGLSNVYRDNSPTALIVVGLLNASSAGLLNYMALVDLLAADFMGPKLQGSVKLQMYCYVAVLLGAGGMSVMAKWA
ncbi:fe(2+) transport protein 1 [Canna indica]|uniref:Fe(2+) transport protein 1 n=1 Tax=Canna indica TaxID=4628 RepID=A0AAQ3QFT7_9LILI|nr:fe(2+) transport protein 1 [Canna indica]